MTAVLNIVRSAGDLETAVNALIERYPHLAVESQVVSRFAYDARRGTKKAEERDQAAHDFIVKHGRPPEPEPLCEPPQRRRWWQR